MKKITVLDGYGLGDFMHLLFPVLIATAWLLPNHQEPWTTFHSDAWMGLCFVSIAGICVFQKKWTIRQGAGLIYVGFALAAIFLQFLIQQPKYAGPYWMSVLYVVGFGLSLQVGAHLQENYREKLANSICVAGGLGAVASVGIQLYQFFDLAQWAGLLDVWITNVSNDRPAGNLGHPNQLATLLLWGMVCVCWAHLAGHIRWSLTIVLSVFLSIGLSLTASKTGAIGLIAMSAAFAFWKPLSGNRNIRASLFVAIVAFFVFAALAPELRSAYRGDELIPINTLARSSVSPRIEAWKMYLGAIQNQPWIGYGWSAGMEAHLAVAELHPNVSGLFGQAHNLLLDLITWNGLPVGAILIAAATYFVVNVFRCVTSVSSATKATMVTLILFHAMVEFPLYYAYFLLPTGLILGALCQEVRGATQTGLRPHFIASKVVYVLVTVLFGVVVFDYLKIERASVNQRFKEQGFANYESSLAPKLLVLDDLQAQLELFQMEPSATSTKDDIEFVESVTYHFPSQYNFIKLIVYLALAGDEEGVTKNMRKITYLTAPDRRPELIRMWEKMQKEHDVLKRYSWVRE